MKAYSDKNKEQRHSYRQNYYLAHRDKALADAKKYHQEHKTERQQYNKTYGPKHYQANKTKISARHKKYWRNNREHLNDWQRKHYRKQPEKFQNNWQRRRTRKRQLPATFTTEDWSRCLDYWHGCCAYCGNQRKLWQTELAQDHFVPVEKGGPYTPTNIVPACNGIDGCNQSKGTQDAYEWMIERFGKKQAAIRLRLIQAYFAQL
jgi:hypothetical protein